MQEDTLRHAFDTFVRQNQACMLAYARSLAGRNRQAEDICQETLLNMYQVLERGKDIDSWKAYLWTSLRRGAQRLAEKQGRTLLSGNTRFSHLYWDDSADTRDETERALKLVDALSQQQRELIELKIFHDLSFRDIAAVLDTPMQTIASRYQSAIQTLQSQWNRTP